MTNEFTFEEIKIMKSVLRYELADNVQELHRLSETPANIIRIKDLKNRISTLREIIEKI